MRLVKTMEMTEWMLSLISWVKQNLSEYFFVVCIRILRFRGDPLHIAFIADGNRTYSKQHNISRYEAYMKGYSI